MALIMVLVCVYVRTYVPRGIMVYVPRGMVHVYVPWYASTGTTETVPREATQALVRVQAHMLARDVVEIRAADIAVELEP
jgi:hypothetical protein